MISLQMIILVALAGFYLGWNIGANDGGNCIGTSIGAGLISFRRGALLVACFVLLGALFNGERVVDTMGKGLVSTTLPVLAVLVALIVAGVVVSFATFFRIPVSTSQAVVGAVMGAGLSMGATVNVSLIGGIFLSWVLCPVGAMFIGWVLYLAIRWILRRTTRTPLVERVLSWLVLVSACYAAYSVGANNAGNAVGPVSNLDVMPMGLLLVVGGASIAIGVITYGRGVAEAIGKGIVPLDLPGALAVQTAAGFVVHIYSLIGIPVSTSHAIVGAVIGIGLLRGIRAVGKRKIAEICIGWVLTPSASALLSFALSSIFVR